MLKNTLKELYTRDLNKLKAEIELYKTDADLWLLANGISNTGGNLALHLCGNLLHFFGATLNASGYVRKRDEEFSTKGLAKTILIAKVDEVLKDVLATLEKQSDAEIAKTYPIEVFGEPITTEYFLIHLSTHLNYHLGQINYHRRIVTNF
jgi:hypothetical protein